MNGIIKRRKTTNYAQIHNGALQTLQDIRSIGLIAHLMSLPENWTIKKMQLYSKFGRGPITNGVEELEAKKYWVDIKYREGKKNLHYYNVSDVPFTDAEVKEMIREVEGARYKIIEISEPFQHLISSGENHQLNNAGETEDETSSIVDFEQLTVNSSKSSVQKRHLINKKEQINNNKINKEKGNIVNINNQLTIDDLKSSLLQACHAYYSEFAPSRWSKQAWNTLIETFVNETIQKGKLSDIPPANINGYVYQSIKNMAYKHDLKNGRIKRKELLFNWLESSEDEAPY